MPVLIGDRHLLPSLDLGKHSASHMVENLLERVPLGSLLIRCKEMGERYALRAWARSTRCDVFSLKMPVLVFQIAMTQSN